MFRERLLELSLATVAILAVATEFFSAFHAISFLSALITTLAIGALWWRGWIAPKLAWRWPTAVLAAGAAGLWAVEGLTALVSPPNSSDAMAYHMPRIVYWIQQGSVEFFATPYLNQIMLQPLNEYVVMHLQLLTGGDLLANMVAWLATGGYVVAASVVAKALGGSKLQQALAAFFAATLPNGILQASGVKNEALLSLLLLSMVYFALVRKPWHAGLACALACLTKGTAFLFAGPLLLLLWPRAIPHAALLVLLINGPFFWRNIDLSGSPLGFDSAHADGKYRWRNDYLGWQPLASNLVRHFTEQVGARPDSWNQRVYEVALSLHRSMGLNANDAATTWPFTEYVAPRSANHETDGNNRWHFALILVAGLYCLRRPRSLEVRILAAIAISILAFSFYLKWQPFMLRMWLPLYVLAVSVAAVAAGRLHWLAQATLCLFLLNGTRLPLLQNWVRPLRGPENMFTQTREDLYYSDMRPWKVRPQYEEVMAGLRASPCREIAFDINYFQLEYPIQALLLERDRGYRFVHVNTTNPSRKYEGRMAGIRPCMLVCLACDRWLEPLP